VIGALLPLRDEAEFERALQRPVAFVFKHSTRCGTSTAALIEVRQYAASHPDVPVYLVDVIEDRALARRIAARVGVPHESPQAILLAEGTAVWSVSHFDVSVTALEEAAARAAGGRAAGRASNR